MKNDCSERNLYLYYKDVYVDTNKTVQTFLTDFKQLDGKVISLTPEIVT